MAKVCDLKRGSLVKINGSPHVVEDLHVQTPSARGGASLYKIRFRNLVTRTKEDGSFKGDDQLPDAECDRREVQFSYAHGDAYTFMDLSDYSEFSLSADELGDLRLYLSDGLEGIHALVSEGRVLTIQLPDVVELEIAECGPAMKGASVTARGKPATMSTGLVVQIPEYLAQGEVIRVDTRIGKFLSRA